MKLSYKHQEIEKSLNYLRRIVKRKNRRFPGRTGKSDRRLDYFIKHLCSSLVQRCADTGSLNDLDVSTKVAVKRILGSALAAVHDKQCREFILEYAESFKSDVSSPVLPSGHSGAFFY